MSSSHDHGAPGHGHSHGHAGTTRLVLAIVLNVGITIAEFIAGIWAGSLALLADAAHNLNDAGSLGISLYARKVATRDPDRRRTFGYRRAEVIGAFVNLITLVLIALYLLKEAVERYLDPRAIDGQLMIVVASIALVANVGTALLLYRSSKDSLNIESAFVHIVADALASVGVIVGGILVVFFDLYVVDPVLTAAISVYILVQSAQMLRQTTRILMESAPPGFDFDGLVATMESVDGACDVHHVHVWQLDEHRTACEAHVVIQKRDLEAMEQIKREMKTRMREAFGIEHATLEFEFDACEGPQRQVIPHG